MESGFKGGKTGSWETSQEAVVAIQRHDDDGLDVAGGHEHGESRQVWDTSEDVPSGFVDWLDVKRKRAIGDSKIFGQGN